MKVYQTPNPPLSSPNPIPQLLAIVQSLVSKSWEHGTLCETLLEVSDPELSVFGSQPFADGPSELHEPRRHGAASDVGSPSGVPSVVPGEEGPALRWARERAGLRGRIEEGLGSGKGNGEVGMREGELEGHEEELFPRRMGDGEFDVWIFLPLFT